MGEIDYVPPIAKQHRQTDDCASLRIMKQRSRSSKTDARHGETLSRSQWLLRGDGAKDDSGSDPLFTEQGSSASQMTAAKVLVAIARPAGCAGKASDAVSVYTQIKMEDAPRSECPDFWLRPPRHKWPKKHGKTMMIQWFSREGTFSDTPRCRNAVGQTVRTGSA